MTLSRRRWTNVPLAYVPRRLPCDSALSCKEESWRACNHGSWGVCHTQLYQSTDAGVRKRAEAALAQAFTANPQSDAGQDLYTLMAKVRPSLSGTPLTRSLVSGWVRAVNILLLLATACVTAAPHVCSRDCQVTVQRPVCPGWNNAGCGTELGEASAATATAHSTNVRVQGMGAAFPAPSTDPGWRSLLCGLSFHFPDCCNT